MPNLTKINKFLDEIAVNYRAELNYYSLPGVAITAHQVGALTQASFTEILIAKNVIASNGHQKYIELERTLSALYCFQLCLDGDYEGFVEAQSVNDKLTAANFEKLCTFVKNIANNEISKAVITNLILLSDLGKSPAVRTLAGAAGIDTRLDTDDLMLNILKLNPEELCKILPGFQRVSEEAEEIKNLVIQSYPLMLTCFGHLYFLEGGVKTLENMAAGLNAISLKERKHSLMLVSLTQLFDAIGAQGHLNMAGSVTCTNNFYRGYMAVINTFEELEDRMQLNTTNPVDESFYLYVDQRAEWLRMTDHENEFVDRSDFEVVLRLACTLRIFDADVASTLKSVYYGLKPEYRHVLRTQLDLHKTSGINTFALSPHYVASSAQNISRIAFEAGNMKLGIDKALNAQICFAMIVKELLEKHPDAIQDTKYPITFAKLASLGNDNPETLDTTLATWALPRPTPKTKIKNLIFDLGHIFIRIDLSRAPVFQAFSDLAKKYERDISPDVIQALITSPEMEAIILAHHLNQINTPDFRAKLKAHLDLECISDEEFDTAWCASILDNPTSVKERLNALKGLIEQGYVIYLLSNNNEIHRLHNKQNFEGLYWGSYFLKQYYSNETGLYKPDPRAYTKVLSDNRLNANETMFFDDIKKYVTAAWGVGIRGRQFTVDYGMNNIKLMIEAIDKAERLAIEKIGKPIITRESTLIMYAAQKFRFYKAPEPDFSDADLSRLEEGLQFTISR